MVCNGWKCWFDHKSAGLIILWVKQSFCSFNSCPLIPTWQEGNLCSPFIVDPERAVVPDCMSIKDLLSHLTCLFLRQKQIKSQFFNFKRRLQNTFNVLYHSIFNHCYLVFKKAFSYTYFYFSTVTFVAKYSLLLYPDTSEWIWNCPLNIPGQQWTITKWCNFDFAPLI